MAGKETPKKLVESDICFICKTKIQLKKDKIRVHGKSKLNISAVITSSISIDTAIYINELFVCRRGCYRLLEKYAKLEKDLQEIQSELKLLYTSEKPRTKRGLTPEECSSPVAKTLIFDLTSTPVKGRGQAPQFGEAFQAEDPEFINVLPATVLATAETSNIQERQVPIFDMPAKSKTTTKVSIVIEYPSKRVTKELNGDLAKVGTALARGPVNRLAGAILKDETLRGEVIAKVTRLISNECNMLCSRRNPSLLRKNSKEDLTNFSFADLCLEWKERAPIFYAFLMACATNKTKDQPEWLPSVTIAGSVLLKQRNSHMTATASILGILMKSRSIEVLLHLLKPSNCYYFI